MNSTVHSSYALGTRLTWWELLYSCTDSHAVDKMEALYSAKSHHHKKLRNSRIVNCAILRHRNVSKVGRSTAGKELPSYGLTAGQLVG